ncbi:Hypothetical protein NTJ_02151 [Nesidiocoris tenuis]|uniref:MADF domain-containing protein n=1 Tax=Nesidiocoris tenuis TaxID=355587 RepID=A0ABN7ABD9_9HEMI|nr:Hypothetical protein NTJ_02151 [Nesidiocoris tenuis]
MVEELLIEKVRHYVFLYDKTHEDYRDSNVRQAAWKEIGKELQMSGPAAKEMWDKLRRCFTNARNRHLEVKKSGLCPKKRVVWKFENQMAFLLPFLETRKTHSNPNETQDEFQDYSAEITKFENRLPVKVSSDPEDNDESTFEEHLFKTQETEAAQVSDLEISHRKKRTEPINKSARVQLHPAAILEETAPPRKRKIEIGPSQGSKCLEGLDDMDLFFLSMARMTKKLPVLEQARIKLELSNLVLSAEIQNQQSSSSNPYRKHDYRFAGHRSPSAGSSTE